MQQSELNDTITRFKTGSLKAATVLTLLLILQPFFLPLALAAVFGALLLPFQTKKWRRVRSPTAKSAILAVGFTLLIVIPIAGFLGAGVLVMKNNVQKSSQFFEQVVSEQKLKRLLSENEIFSSVRGALGLSEPGLTHYFSVALQKFQTFAMEFLEYAIMGAPAILLSFFVLVLSLFFILKDWPRLRDWACHHSFLSRPGTMELFDTFRSASQSVVLAGALSGCVQSVILATGAWASGAANPAVVLVITFFSSFFPLIGTGLVSLTIIAYTLLSAGASSSLIWFVVAAAMASVADNVVYPAVMGGRNQLNPLLSFLSVVGGIEIFGLFGIFLGPIVLMMSLKAYQLISRRENRERQEREGRQNAGARLQRFPRAPTLDV